MMSWNGCKVQSQNPGGNWRSMVRLPGQSSVAGLFAVADLGATASVG